MTVHIDQLALKSFPIEASHVERARTADERLDFICFRTVPHGVDRIAERVDIDFLLDSIEAAHFQMPSKSDCRYMAMRAISTFPEISPASIPPAF